MINKFFINTEDVFTKWGIVFRRGVFAELLKAPKRKEGLAVNWRDANGTERDDSPFFESIEYNLDIYIIADNSSDFWLKYNDFTNFLLTAGYFTFRSEELNRNYSLLYMEMSAFKNLTPLGWNNKVASRFTLKLINDFPV